LFIINDRLNTTEEKISEFNNKAKETIEYEKQICIEDEQNIEELWDNFK
jgi:hypothetical protein